MQPNGTNRTRTKGLASDELRHHNLGAVLEILHLSGPTTRSELAARTGLNRSTIARLIAELAGARLVAERPAATRSSPGRPSPVVSPTHDAAPVLAMEVRLDSIAAALIGLGGNVIEQTEAAGDWGTVPAEQTATALGRLAGDLLAGFDRPLVGAAVALPGIVRLEDGFVHFAPNLNWTAVPFADLLRDALPIDIPVTVGNEANFGALAEHRRELPDVQDLVYVHADVGVGVGIIVGGHRLTGSSGYAGEGGHMVVRHDGASCRCGSSGCWETEIGQEALLRRTLGDEARPGKAAIDALLARLADEDEAALAGMDEVGYWIGVGIGDLANLLNPQVVVIGGIHARLFEWLEAPIRRGLTKRALDVVAEGLRVVPSSMGPNAPLMGAAEVVLSDAIAQPSQFPGLGRASKQTAS